MWLARSASAPLTFSQSGMERSSIGSYRETSKQDSVGEINERNITGTKQVIDDAAARFWAKRGLQDPSKSRINYGRNVTSRTRMELSDASELVNYNDLWMRCVNG